MENKGDRKDEWVDKGGSTGNCQTGSTHTREVPQ